MEEGCNLYEEESDAEEGKKMEMKIGGGGGGGGGHGTRIYNVKKKNPTLIFPRFIVLLPISPFSLRS